MNAAIRLHPADTVAVLVRAVEPGERLFLACADALPDELSGLTAVQAVPGGHKVAIRALAAGDTVRKYGHPIGRALCDITPGQWVHDHNLGTALTPDDAFPDPPQAPSAAAAPLPCTTFMGYARPNRRAGIRNDLWIIPCVGCINGELEALAAHFDAPEWITGVKVLAHPFGCSQLGADLHHTAAVLAGLARNPNAAGVVMAGLGCENLQQSMLRPLLADQSHVAWVTLQDADGADRLLAELSRLAEGAPRSRTVCPVSDLAVGVKCGGSDGYSGLTANPLVGRFADTLCASGGVIVATEIPEMFGAEPALLPRMASVVRRDFLALDRQFRDYFTTHNQPVYENPSPGNRDGGISTLEEKSLGAVEKAGSAPVVRVLTPGAPIGPESGVQITPAPGNDLVSCTALAAAGAQCILFTTGRGTPFGTVIPTLKLSTNNELAARHPGWIDFNAGVLLSGTPQEQAHKALCDLVIDTANGLPAAHERKNIAQIALFKDGVIL